MSHRKVIIYVAEGKDCFAGRGPRNLKDSQGRDVEMRVFLTEGGLASGIRHMRGYANDISAFGIEVDLDHVPMMSLKNHKCGRGAKRLKDGVVYSAVCKLPLLHDGECDLE